MAATLTRATARTERVLRIVCAATLATTLVTTVLVSDTLDRAGHSSRLREATPQPPPHLRPSTVALRLTDLPRGFAIDHANTGPVNWHDLAKLATTRRLALLRNSGLIAEYDASYYRRSTWHGQRVDFLGVRTVSTIFRTAGGATRAFDDAHNPVLSLTRLMTRVPTTTSEADEWQEAAHTDHTGHTTILVRWRAGRITGGLVLFGSGPLATTTYATTLAQISLRHALHAAVKRAAGSLTRLSQGF